MSNIEDGTPFLFFARQGSKAAALPLIIRDTLKLPWGCDSLRDASSAYGYPGVISTPGAADDDAFREMFQRELLDTLSGERIVSMFLRLHPIFSAANLLADIGDIVHSGDTVAVDLLLSEQEYTSQTRKSHRYELRKSARAGTVVCEDPEFENLDVFIELYEETMKRVNASEYYFFPRTYYKQLRETLADHTKLVHAVLDNEIIGSSLFFFTKPIVQYHLSATRNGYERLSPSRVILDHVRQWGSKNGFEWLHLGGGVGGRDDYLMRFKGGFSKLRLPYKTVRAIVDDSAYRDLCAARLTWLKDQRKPVDEGAFFPEYRNISEAVVGR